MRREFERLGCSVARLGRFTYVTAQGRSFTLLESETSFTSLTGFRILKDKRLTNALLRHHGLSVAEQMAFSREQKAQARQAVKALGSAVVKPADGNKGRGVTVGVTEDTMEEAWRLACAETNSDILVESLFEGGVEARYLVIDGRCVAVCRRIPPFVRGDGSASLVELIERRNSQRLRNPDLAHCPIRLDVHRLNFLHEQGFELDSVPGMGQIVLIDIKAGLSTGGEAMDITDEVHPEMKQIAVRVSEVVPGLDVIGIDLLSKDHSRPPGPDDYIIIEVNTRPGIGTHIYPSYGDPRNVCRLLAESCLAKAQTYYTDNSNMRGHP